MTQDFIEISDELVEDYPAEPGFAALLPVLQAARRGGVSEQVLRDYHRVLAPRLDEACERLESMQVPEGLWERARHTLDATWNLLDEMAVVLECVLMFLSDRDLGLLDEAIERLALVHGNLKSVLV